mmetsp:Transcript_19293/g.49044  ORF Transcript_19293/g.49044 Transcript_19293/m.49044 type:complete len:299 (-) Transcript_19293:116-1012(-)
MSSYSCRLNPTSTVMLEKMVLISRSDSSAFSRSILRSCSASSRSTRYWCSVVMSSLMALLRRTMRSAGSPSVGSKFCGDSNFWGFSHFALSISMRDMPSPVVSNPVAEDVEDTLRPAGLRTLSGMSFCREGLDMDCFIFIRGDRGDDNSSCVLTARCGARVLWLRASAASADSSERSTRGEGANGMLLDPSRLRGLMASACRDRLAWPSSTLRVVRDPFDFFPTSSLLIFRSTLGASLLLLLTSRPDRALRRFFIATGRLAWHTLRHSPSLVHPFPHTGGRCGEQGMQSWPNRPMEQR